MRVNPDKKSSFSAIDVYEWQIEDAPFHEYRESLACPEGRCSADLISGVALGCSRIAGADVLAPNLPCEFLG